MNEILFGQSYYLKFDPKLWEAKQPYPPLGTLYAASFVRNRGYTVALFDAMLAESEREWETALERHRPRYAVLFEDNFNYLSKMCLLRMRQAAFTMIAAARQRLCTVIVCGADATDHPEDYIGAGADYVLLGEGEQTLVELIDRLSGRSDIPFEEIPGLVFRLPDQNPPLTFEVSQLAHAPPHHRNPRRPDIRDLDSLPFPAWDLVDLPRYCEIWMKHHGYFSMNMVTTRGCPFHCNWCAKPIWGQRYNVRSPENVVAELKWLVETYHPDHISFVDDIFGLKPGWLPEFAERVSQERVKTPFKCLSRVDLLLKPGEIEALQRAGCRIVWVGAESGSQKILDAMDKGTRVEQIYEAALRLHRLGVQVGFFLQFGYPGETRQDIQKTFQMVHDCLPDDIGMSVSYPLPGTKFHSAVREQLGARQNWVDSSDLAMLYRGPFSTAFYRQLHTVLHKEFRRRKAWEQITSWRGRASAGKAVLPSLQSPSQTRSILSVVYHTITLPIERTKLNRLERLPHQGIDPLPPMMSPEAAAEPSTENGN